MSMRTLNVRNTEKLQRIDRNLNPKRSVKEMKIISQFSIMAFIKSGQNVATFFLFYTFMGMFFHGQFVWVEPNRFILTLEILLSASWVVGSLIDTIQTIKRLTQKQEPQKTASSLNNQSETKRVNQNERVSIFELCLLDSPPATDFISKKHIS